MDINAFLIDVEILKYLNQNELMINFDNSKILFFGIESTNQNFISEKVLLVSHIVNHYKFALFFFN